jgi:site-specific DNA recombinase
MVGTWSAQGGRYICALRYPRYVPGACTGRSLSAILIEACIWDHVKALLSDPAVLRTQYEHGRGDPAVDVRAEQERVRLERKLAALDREVTRRVDAYQAEVIELTELAERRRRIEDHGRMLRERVREIAQQRTERTAELRLLEGVDAFCTSVRGAMDDPSFAVQQKVLQLVVDRIVVEDSRVIIEHVVPTGPVRLQTEHQADKKRREGPSLLVATREAHPADSIPSPSARPHWGSRRYRRHAQHDMTAIISSTGSSQVKLVNEYRATIS